MSQLYDLRADLAASIIAGNFGFTADNIIIKRQTDLWNDVATALAMDDLGITPPFPRPPVRPPAPSTAFTGKAIS